MASASGSETIGVASDPEAFKVAIAVALLRFQKQQQQHQQQHQQQQSNHSSTASGSADHWKRKAKDRKRELFRLRKELEQLEDRERDGEGGIFEKQDLFSRVVSCSCHFFDECGELGSKRIRLGVVEEGKGDNGGQEHWIDEVLRRRFLRLVRWNERRKKSNGSIQRHLIEYNAEDKIEQLSTSANFLVELSGTISQDKSNSSFVALSHQAVDFIIASVKSLLSLQKDNELVEDIITGLITCLTKRMCSSSDKDGVLGSESDAEIHIQHLLRMLGSDSYIGQHVMLSVSQRISILAENLLLIDPFDDSFPHMNDWMFMMIQLIEFLISDNMQSWTKNEELDNRLFEEWLRSVLQAHKALTLLECRNGLYILYMERVTGELAKRLGPLSRQGKLSLDILSSFLC